MKNWGLALLAALVVHSVIFLNFKLPTEGALEKPAGAPVAVSGSLASILGGAVEANAVEHDTDVADEAPVDQAEPVDTSEPIETVSSSEVEPTTEPTEATPTTSPDVTSAESDVAQPIAQTSAPIEARTVTESAVTSVQAAEAQPAEELAATPTVTKPLKPAEPKKVAKSKAKRLTAKKARKRTTKKKSGRKGARKNRAGGNKRGAAGTARGGKGGKGRASAGSIRSYAARVRARIASRRPGASGRGRVVVSFGISPSGGLRYARIVRRSGNASLDRAALAAVRRSSPFPRPPKGAKASQLRFTIPFSFR